MASLTGRGKETKSSKRGRTILKDHTTRFVQDWIDMEKFLAQSVRIGLEAQAFYSAMLQTENSIKEKFELHALLKANTDTIMATINELRILIEGIAPYVLPKHSVIPYLGDSEKGMELMERLVEIRKVEKEAEVALAGQHEENVATVEEEVEVSNILPDDVARSLRNDKSRGDITLDKASGDSGEDVKQAES